MIRGAFLLWLAWLVQGASCAGSGTWIPVHALWRYQLLTSEVPSADWMRPDFDDRAWPEGRAGFSVGRYGYDEAATALPSTLNGAPVRGLLLRHRWVVEDPSTAAMLILRVDFEDGLVGWLNGEEVFRKGLPAGDPVTGHEAPAARVSGAVEWLDLTPFRDRLVAGTNVLALMTLDAPQFSPRLLVWPELRANFVRGPWVQNVSAAGATLAWATLSEVPAWVEYGPASRPSEVERMELAPTAQGAVTLTGLVAGTPYRYRVGWLAASGAEVTSEWLAFTTLKDAGDITFLVVGDTGSGSVNQYAVASAMERTPADLVLHTGDIAYPSFTLDQIDLRCFGVYEAMMGRVPFFFTVGNHDFYRGDAAYLEAFHHPTNSMTGTEHYYSFDHGDVHFVSLFIPWFGVSQFGQIAPDGGGSAPYRWLTNDLAMSSKPWKVVFFHQPLRTSGPHILDDYEVSGRSDVEEIREVLLPVFARHGVQMVFNGHDHAWERFTATNGVQSVVTGGGGAVLYPAYRPDPGSLRYLARHHFVRVRVSGAVMNLEALAPDGEVLDAFTVVRDRDGDGLDDDRELALGTDPNHPDSDGDRLGDGWEVTFGLNPRSDQGRDGAEGDPDGDGYSNWEEFESRTDPLDPAVTLHVELERAGEGLLLRWRAMIGRSYDIESAEGLPGPFQSIRLPGFPRRAESVDQSQGFSDSAAGPAGARWYRVREVR